MTLQSPPCPLVDPKTTPYSDAFTLDLARWMPIGTPTSFVQQEDRQQIFELCLCISFA